MTEARWLDADSAARHLCLRLDAFTRKVRAGLIPEPSYSLGERTPRWWSPDLDTVMRTDTASTNPRTAVQALVEKIETQGKGRTRRQAHAR
jgi:hypothetical protein